MYARCWAVCRVLQQMLAPLVHNIAPKYLLSFSSFIASPVHTPLSTSLQAHTHRTPSIGRTTLGLEESLEMDPSGFWLEQPPTVTPSTSTHCVCPITARGHTTQPQGLHSWNFCRPPTIFWPFAHAGVNSGLALVLLPGLIRNSTIICMI